MEGMDLQKIMQLSQQMQSRMAEMQKQLERQTLVAAAGGGMVEVTADGKGNIKGVSIDPTVVDPAEVEMLEDLIVAAASEVQRRARPATRQWGQLFRANSCIPLRPML